MNHVEGLIDKGIRIDSRRIDETRSVSLVCKEPGSVEVTIGNSKALGECFIEATEPKGRLDQGIFKINVNFLQMANPNFHDSRGTRDLIEIGKVVERAILSTRAIDIDGLVIVRGKLVWKIVVCIQILADFGNLMDVVSIAAISSLLTAERREVEICGTDVRILTPQERCPTKLPIHHIPVTISFGITETGVPLLDPSDREEAVCKSRLTIAINADGEVCAVQKSGTPISMRVIQKCCEIALHQAKKFINYIKDRVNELNEQSTKKK